MMMTWVCACASPATHVLLDACCACMAMPCPPPSCLRHGLAHLPITRLPGAEKAREKRAGGQTYEGGKGTVAKLLSAEWQAMSPEEKAPFQLEAQQQK